ncbi:hypothetical protein VC83_01541 [Pseudogymnoascus destructans]|uniref:Uncharacterized protein n=1 Tax=Pseudogymnoascus destructans TaxID=655981 RepID=A0A177AIR9_9PEZI|nr:uncharacterized protein VC83_01541 [Pseudogymnoascus destructans]OAF61965.1 hypothetical protein VC83_01541 [Pseudogymnoascus destructans]
MAIVTSPTLPTSPTPALPRPQAPSLLQVSSPAPFFPPPNPRPLILTASTAKVTRIDAPPVVHNACMAAGDIVAGECGSGWLGYETWEGILRTRESSSFGQIRRRYKPRERKSEDGGVILEFDLKPSDPDFPFEMTALASLLAEEAQAKRNSETRQLKARLGRLPLYKKSGDGIAYTLLVEPRKPGELPVPLRSIKTIVLFVPLLYPLQNCRITLEGVKPEDAKATEAEERAKKEKDTTLMGHVNFMAQNMHVLAKTPPLRSPI